MCIKWIVELVILLGGNYVWLCGGGTCRFLLVSFLVYAGRLPVINCELWCLCGSELVVCECVKRGASIMWAVCEEFVNFHDEVVL